MILARLLIHYRGGGSRDTNLLWEINGTEGDLQLAAGGGQAQIFEMTVRGGTGETFRRAGTTRPSRLLACGRLLLGAGV